MRNGVISGTAGRGVISEQGIKMGRSSILHVCLHGNNGMNDIDVGEYVTPLCEPWRADRYFPDSNSAPRQAFAAWVQIHPRSSHT